MRFGPRRPGSQRILLAVAMAGVFALAALGVSRWYILHSADGHVFRTQEALPHRNVAIVLGAGVRADGTPSLALRQRVGAAVELFDAGEIEHLLMSGDNGRRDYDEPTVMRQLALAGDIDPADVTLDFAGFDTWDSCRRAHDIFGVERATIITHSFHIDRAVTLCRRAGIDAVGFAVPDELGAAKMASLRLREWPASVKATFDLVMDRDPVFLGPRESLDGSAGHTPSR